MWFKNLQIYRLPAPWAFAPEEMEAALKPQAFVPASSSELLRQGWASPRENGALVHSVNHQMLMVLATEKKLLPSSVINQVARAKADELEEQQGFRPGRKAMKEIKERVADELLPRAFSVRSNTLVWIDPVNGWLVVDAASPSKADDVIKLLLKAVDRMPLESLRVQRSPVAVMTGWLEADEVPYGFTIDQDAIMRATGESKAQIGYKRHTLEPDDMRRHIAAGKQCTRLAMTWQDRISFVLTETLAIKSVKPLDVIKEAEAVVYSDDERFDNDVALMTGELAKMMSDLIEALGGEGGDPASKAPRGGDHQYPARQDASGQPKLERAVRLTSDLYAQRDRMREALGGAYASTIKATLPHLQAEMETSSKGALEAAIKLAKEHPSSGQVLLCAAMELMEPSQPDQDPLYDQAVAVVLKIRRASISLVQRHLMIGYNRAARLIEAMEEARVISPMRQDGHREVLVPA